ncbi:heparinase II/III domain-containing protein [Microbacterium hibisci]|uniref:heparinase II/III domain-containing protein n=1 Tax=Microbacterium hibisci TaxID=2036000 RepID=UPI0027DA10A2|nr:heparinase II/III family protein [Microbacterium hibisci]
MTTTTFEGALASVYLRQSGTDIAGFEAALATLLAEPERALPVAPATDRTVWGPTGSADPVSVADILGHAREDLARPWGIPLATAAARLHDDGDREGWESVVFERQRRLARAAIAAAHHLDDPERGPVWLGEVLDGVWLICEQTSWCWPAHDDAFRERGSVLPTVTAPYLDLGAGEAVALLTWIDQLLGARLDARYPGIRSRIRREARVRVFEPFARRRDWHWLGLDGDVHNWNPWIHGNVLLAALRLLDDPAEVAERARIVALALEGIDRYVSVLPADGAIDEGYAYWWNGACRALEALDLVRHATGGVLDASGIPALRETVAFPHRMHLGGDWYLNLADGQARPPADQPWHALHRAAQTAGDTDAAAHAASHRRAGIPAATEHEGFGRLLRGITDPAWVGAEQEPSPFPRDVWLPSTEVLVARENGGTAAGLTVAVKGGHNGEHHNHNDVGSFVVASDGVPVIVDAGRPTYTLQTFGPDRYEIWTMQSGWHNVPVIGGLEQSPGAGFAASAVDAWVGADASSLSLELSGAYAGAAGPWQRAVRLERPARRVVIEDAWGAPRTIPHAQDVSSAGAGAPSAQRPEPLPPAVAGDETPRTRANAQDVSSAGTGAPSAQRPQPLPPAVERARNERDETPRTIPHARDVSSAGTGAPSAQRPQPLPPAVERARNERDETPRSDAPTQVRMLLAGDVRRDAASVVVTPLGGAAPVRVSWPDGVDAALVVRELDDPMLTSVWGSRLTRLDLDVSARDGVVVTVELDLTNAEDAR